MTPPPDTTALDAQHDALQAHVDALAELGAPPALVAQARQYLEDFDHWLRDRANARDMRAWLAAKEARRVA